MKKLSLLLVMVFSVAAIAAEDGEQTSTHDSCGSVRFLAYSVMGARQTGVPVDKAMEVVEKYDFDFVREVVLDAYKKPIRQDIRQDLQLRRKMQNDFAESWYVTCQERNKK